MNDARIVHMNSGALQLYKQLDLLNHWLTVCKDGESLSRTVFADNDSGAARNAISSYRAFLSTSPLYEIHMHGRKKPVVRLRHSNLSIRINAA